MHDITLLASYQNIYQATSEWAVNLVIADGQFNLPQGFVCEKDYNGRIRYATSISLDQSVHAISCDHIWEIVANYRF